MQNICLGADIVEFVNPGSKSDKIQFSLEHRCVFSQVAYPFILYPIYLSLSDLDLRPN